VETRIDIILRPKRDKHTASTAY